MKQLKEIIKKESKILLYIFVALVIVFKIVFYKENLWVLIRTVFGIYWLFLLPGFIIMYFWRKELEFIERLIFGTVLGIAVTGLTSYYLTLFNINIRIQFILVPLLIVFVSMGIYFFLNRKKINSENS